jgi:hypothetical protein
MVLVTAVKEKKKAMYVVRKTNTEERVCNHCCSGKARSITYSECVFVVLGIQQECPCAMCPARLYNIFPNFLINARFKQIIQQKCVF